MVIRGSDRMRWLIHSGAGPGIIAAVVFRQERAYSGKFIAVGGNGTQWVVQLQHARFLPWALAISHLNERRGHQLRFTAAACRDSRARLVGPVAHAGTELAGNHWRNDA